MTRQDIQTSSQPNAIDGKIGYKHMPVKSQFRKGQSGNPHGQRNLTPVLIDVLRQTVKVKQGGKTQRMSKGEALIQILLSKAQNGDSRAIKAVLLVRETIAAARAAGISLTTSQRDALRELFDAARAARTPLTTSQIAALTESIGLTRAAKASPTVTRRPVNRIDKISPKPAEQSNTEPAASAQTPTDQTALPPVPTVARTGTYRKVNRRLPTPPPTTTPCAKAASQPK